MKATQTPIVGVLATLVALAHANSDIITLNANSGTYITEANATLVLPALPSSVAGDYAYWSAIMMKGQTSFLQGVSSASPAGSYCTSASANGKNWCNFAYSLVGASDATVGDPVTAAPGSRVKTSYKINAQTQLWDQNVYIDDQLLSSVSTSKGEQGGIFYISIECASGSCGAFPAHSWEDISIALSQADSTFGDAGAQGWQFGGTGGEMSTADGGLTWDFATLNVPAQQAQ